MLDVIPFEQVFDEQLRPRLNANTRAAIAAADVVVAFHAGSQREFTVFGTPAFEDTVRIGQELALRTVRISLQEQGDQLEKLAALVQSVKRGLDAGARV